MTYTSGEKKRNITENTLTQTTRQKINQH